MAYSSWSVTTGETPSTVKWNVLGTNDAFFNTQVGSNFSSGTTSTVWYEELGRTQLGSSGDTISVSSFSARKYLRLQMLLIPSGSINTNITFNSDTGNNYSYRYSANGASDTSLTSQANIEVHITGTLSNIVVIDVLNIAAQEKLAYWSNTGLGAAGATTAPSRLEGAAKWTNTSAQITTVTLTNDDPGSYDTGSLLTVLGHD